MCALYVVAAPDLKASSYIAENRMTNVISKSALSRALIEQGTNVLILQEIIPYTKLGRKCHPSFPA